MNFTFIKKTKYSTTQYNSKHASSNKYQNGNLFLFSTQSKELFFPESFSFLLISNIIRIEWNSISHTHARISVPSSAVRGCVRVFSARRRRWVAAAVVVVAPRRLGELPLAGTSERESVLSIRAERTHSHVSRPPGDSSVLIDNQPAGRSTWAVFICEIEWPSDGRSVRRLPARPTPDGPLGRTRHADLVHAQHDAAAATQWVPTYLPTSKSKHRSARVPLSLTLRRQRWKWFSAGASFSVRTPVLANTSFANFTD